MANPDFLDVLGDEMGRVYEACSDRIVINLARYFRYLKPDEQPGGAFVYQAQKLQEFGKLTRETMTIIAEMTGGADRALIDCLQTAILDALETVEPELRKAAAAGLLGGGNVPPQVDPRTMDAFRLYYQQAADKLNLVNTVMLESTENAYRATVSDIVNRMQRAQTIVDTATGEIVSGVESFNQALKQATQQMVDNGITGFVDHGGHHWRPETYVAMDMRTTFHNVSRAAFWERNAEYANDLYLVSQHPGARPLCYPWQCKVISRQDQARDVTDGAGNPVHVYAQSETTYGEPAGLFGINCGHHPELFVPGATMVPEVRQDEAQNAKTYAESQKQRGLERDFRKARLEYDVAKAQGAPGEEIKEKQGALKRADERLDRFAEETGRKRRREREYAPVNATWPDEIKQTQTWTQANNKPSFTPAKTIEEVITRMEADGVKYPRLQSMSLEHANNTLEAVETLPVDARPTVIANGKETSLLTGRPMGRKSDQWYGVTYDYRAFDFSVQKLGYTPDYSGGICVGLNTSKYKTLESITSAKISEQQKYIQKTGREWFFNTEGRATAFHEMGHVYYDVKGAPDGWEMIAQKWANESKCDMLKSPSEAFAEAWAAYHTRGRELPPYIKTIIEGLK